MSPPMDETLLRRVRRRRQLFQREYAVVLMETTNPPIKEAPLPPLCSRHERRADAARSRRRKP